jgi:hypothetical protein
MTRDFPVQITLADIHNGVFSFLRRRKITLVFITATARLERFSTHGAMTVANPATADYLRNPERTTARLVTKQWVCNAAAFWGVFVCGLQESDLYRAVIRIRRPKGWSLTD